MILTVLITCMEKQTFEDLYSTIHSEGSHPWFVFVFVYPTAFSKSQHNYVQNKPRISAQLSSLKTLNNG